MGPTLIFFFFIPVFPLSPGGAVVAEAEGVVDVKLVDDADVEIVELDIEVDDEDDEVESEFPFGCIVIPTPEAWLMVSVYFGGLVCGFRRRTKRLSSFAMEFVTLIFQVVVPSSPILMLAMDIVSIASLSVASCQALS
jgi:hypothetical protein